MSRRGFPGPRRNSRKGLMRAITSLAHEAQRDWLVYRGDWQPSAHLKRVTIARLRRLRDAVEALERSLGVPRPPVTPEAASALTFPELARTVALIAGQSVLEGATIANALDTSDWVLVLEDGRGTSVRLVAQGGSVTVNASSPL